MGFNTELLHGTKTGDPVTGATLTPVYQSSAFFQPSAEQHEKLFHNKAAGYSYTRINNPTIAAFEERMTVLEKGVASVACASGMAAITNALLNIVGSVMRSSQAPACMEERLIFTTIWKRLGLQQFLQIRMIWQISNPRSRIRRESSSRRRLAIQSWM